MQYLPLIGIRYLWHAYCSLVFEKVSALRGVDIKNYSRQLVTCTCINNYY